MHATVGPYVLPWDRARTYGPVDRFDPHPLPVGDDSGVGVLYTALSVRTCLAEVFQDSRVVMTEQRPYATSWPTTRDLDLVDLTGTAALLLGAADAIGADRRRARTQAWARALLEAFPAVDGFWHRSAMDGGDCVCLVSCVASGALDAVPPRPAFSLPLTHRSMADVVDVAASEIGYLVV
ncbi:RES family NAD+ phosphorylase [Pseudokineococcus basanitobsidens]|uniref:RES family NAD+ phosphorylase n=1 Tax=Pseudokineococcus basanitobsidens TaxID=1926649 RepID=UPI0030D8260E